MQSTNAAALADSIGRLAAPRPSTTCRPRCAAVTVCRVPCSFPLPAYRTESGGIVFSELRKHGKNLVPLEVPCGQCIRCRLERSRQWAMRCMHEASLYDENSFVTLTYDDAHLPYRGSLHYPHFQKFIRSLRKRTGEKIRFFVCGEYGELNFRPHFHALLFGFGFPDRVPLLMLDSSDYYRSALLDKCWPHGNSVIGNVTFESAAYCARYCMKKVTGPGAADHYSRVDDAGFYQLEPEFAHMSLKPGIGAPFLKKFKTDIYPHDYCIVNGRQVKPPKYYDMLSEKLVREVGPPTADDFYSVVEVKERRALDAMERWHDNTTQRLLDKEAVAKGRMAQSRRKL